MSISGDSDWARKKSSKRLGGMAEALSITFDLGFSIPPIEEDLKTSSSSSIDRSDDLIRVLRELTIVQRNIANLQVELQRRKDDKNVAHLMHVSEMKNKCKSLARITMILKDVIQNKKQFSELLQKEASDYGALTAYVADFQWSQNFREPPSVWGESSKEHLSRVPTMQIILKIP